MPKLSGREKLERRMAKLPAACRSNLVQGLRDGAADLVTTMKARAPKDKGNLAASIRSEETGDDLKILVKAGGQLTTKKVRNSSTAPDYDYALGTEFGNAHVEAQQFFFPSVRVRKSAIKRHLADKVRKGLKE